MGKTVKLNCDHEVVWSEWHKNEHYPTIGASVFCTICEEDSFIVHIYPEYYTFKPGILVTVEQENIIEWRVDSVFPDPNTMIDYLERCFGEYSEEWVRYGWTVFATKNALLTAEKEYLKEIDALEERDKQFEEE